MVKNIYLVLVVLVSVVSAGCPNPGSDSPACNEVTTNNTMLASITLEYDENVESPVKDLEAQLCTTELESDVEVEYCVPFKTDGDGQALVNLALLEDVTGISFIPQSAVKDINEHNFWRAYIMDKPADSFFVKEAKRFALDKDPNPVQFTDFCKKQIDGGELQQAYQEAATFYFTGYLNTMN